MITVELEHFSLDKICDSGQCFRMRKLGDGHFSMVAGDQYLEMYQKDGVVISAALRRNLSVTGCFILIWIRIMKLT